MFSVASYGQQINLINRPEPTTSGSRTPVNSSPSQSISASSIGHCDSSQHMSQTLLRSLMLDPEGIRIEFDDEDLTLARVHVPRHYSTCFDLEVVMEPTENNNLFVSFKNTRFEDLTNADGDIIKDSYTQYLECLENEGALSHDNGSAEVDAEKMTIRRYQSHEFRFPRGTFDQRNNVHVHYLGPGQNENGGYPAYYSGDQERVGCYARERMTPEGDLAIYVSPENRAAMLAYEACRSGDVTRILNALGQLDSSEVGNARDLQLVLRQALTSELDKEGQRIYERLRNVARNFELEDGIPSISREEARRYADEYVGLLNDLDTVVLTPYIEFIDELMEERERASDERKEEIDELIAYYNDKIRNYSENSRSYGYDRVMNTLRFYGNDLAHYARDIEGFNLKSHHYGRYYVEGRPNDPRGPRISSHSDVRDQTDRRLNSFDNAFRRFAAEDAVRTGDTRPLRDAQNRYTNLMSARDQRFRQDMQKIGQDYQSCVGWFHTDFKVRQCQERAQRSQRQALQRRERYNRQIQRAGEDMTNFSAMRSFYEQNRDRERDRNRDRSLFWYEEDYESGIMDYGLSNPSGMYSLFEHDQLGRAPSSFVPQMGMGLQQPGMMGPQQMQQGPQGYWVP